MADVAVTTAVATTEGIRAERRRAPQLTTLPSGVRVVTESVGSVRSIALGLWIRTGSRDESPAQAGLSHFLEHLLFKGTDRFSSREIDELFDSLGAEVNAGTGKETTSVYSRFLDRHLDQAFDVLADMVLHPSYPDIDSERDVVIEEIAMYEDEPQDKVHDVLSTAVFGDHPLGRPIIGRADVVSSVPIPEIAAFHDERYVGGNLVLSAAGNVDHERLVELAQQKLDCAALPGVDGPAEAAPTETNPRRCFHAKETEQYHLCVGGPGHRARRRPPLRPADPRHRARRLDLLAAVPGGAREARPGLLRLLVREPVRRQRPDRHLRRHAARQRRPGDGGHRP